MTIWEIVGLVVFGFIVLGVILAFETEDYKDV